ncbi:hypothetical protein BJ944DRAFT_290391 [Cunninghamella echinulata]|nr:hypothetical protein BJ944DRAFT_290391 [Cunninghamella echinulata]
MDMGQGHSVVTKDEPIQDNEIKTQLHVAQIKLQIDCTCRKPNDIKICGRCDLTFCGKCNFYQYLWLPTDMCNTCVLMVFMEKMSREDLYTLGYSHLKKYLKNYDLSFKKRLNKHKLINIIITNRPLKDEQHNNYKDKRLKELMLRPNELKNVTSKKTSLKKLYKSQQERFQLYMMKKENLIGQAEYDLAIKMIPLEIKYADTSLGSTSLTPSWINKKKRNNSNNPKTKNNRSKGKEKATKNNNGNTSGKINKSSPPTNPDDNKCKICFDAVQSCVLMECGHLVTCYECGQKMTQCPICRSHIIRVVKIFKV